jgi:hypothetical protein
MKRRVRDYVTRRRTFFWLLIIVLVSFVLSAFTGGISMIIERFYRYMDPSYRPMDRDRGVYEQEKASKARE